jgi:hypothetical protein
METEPEGQADWLLTEIATGLQKLYPLSLDRTPAFDVIPGTALAWFEGLTHGRAWDQQRDTPRLRAAFSRLLAEADRWPAPCDLLARLPEPPPAPALTHDLGIPAERAAKSRHLALVLGAEYNPATADPNYDPVAARRAQERAEAERALRQLGVPTPTNNPPSRDEE